MYNRVVSLWCGCLTPCLLERGESVAIDRPEMEDALVDRRSTAATEEEDEEYCGIAGAKPRVDSSRERKVHTSNSSVVLVVAVKDFIGISRNCR